MFYFVSRFRRFYFSIFVIGRMIQANRIRATLCLRLCIQFAYTSSPSSIVIAMMTISNASLCRAAMKHITILRTERAQ